MKKITIEQLAQRIQEAKKDDQPQPIFFLGAGASVSGNIPPAGQIEEDIVAKFSDDPAIKTLGEDERSYSKLMKCLTPRARNDLLNGYIDQAKINITHIYLAQLLKEGFVDYVLTVNFDNLVLRALALYHIFPTTYDLAILKDLTTTAFREKSVVYLHGQHPGPWLLNTPDEKDKVKTAVKSIFDSIKNGRPWIFIGYGGSDPIFECVKNLGRFDDGLYWVGPDERDPGRGVRQFLNRPNVNAYCIRGYDSDAFMLKLNHELGLKQPDIFAKPFSSLKSMLNKINDVNDEDHYKGVRERFEIAKKHVDKAIKQFEEGKREQVDEDELSRDKLKKEIINILISEAYDKDQIEGIARRVKEVDDATINRLSAGLYSDWGADLGALAKTQSGRAPVDLYSQAFEKYEKALAIKPDLHEAFYNWGNDLGALAGTQSDRAAEKLYGRAFEKYEKALAIKPDLHEAFYKWGAGLGALAGTRSGRAAEKLYGQAFEKYEKALAIKPDLHEAFNNWGNDLGALAGTRSGRAAEKLYDQAFEKYEKALAIKPDKHEAYYNWGIDLGALAGTRSGRAAEKLYGQAFEKYEKALAIKPDLHEAFYNWGAGLGALAGTRSGRAAEELYGQAFEKYEKALAIKPDLHEAFYNWGNGLGALAGTRSGRAAEELYGQAFEKYEKALAIKPDLHEAFNNWGNGLGALAGTRSGRATEKLYGQAFEKYEKALEIKPDKHKTFNNWGAGLCVLAKTQSDRAAERLYGQAFEKFQKAIDLGGSHYNLACLCAIRGDMKGALHHLDITLQNNELAVDSIITDEYWRDHLDDADYKAVIDKYSGSASDSA